MTQLTPARRACVESVAGLPVVHLCSTTCAALKRKLEKLRYPNPKNIMEWDQFQSQAIHIVREYLPASIISLLSHFTQDSHQPGFVIEGLPIGKLPSPPTDGCRPVGKSPVSEAMLISILFYLGVLVCYLEEKFGAAIQEVTPQSGMEATQSNAGRGEFRKHSDNAFLGRFNLDGILLFGLNKSRNIRKLKGLFINTRFFDWL